MKRPSYILAIDQGTTSSRAIVLGKKSGKHSIAHAVKRLGLNATDAQMDAALGKVKELSIKVGRTVTDDEFKQIVAGLPA